MSREKIERFTGNKLTYGQKLSLMRKIIKGYEADKVVYQNLTDYLKDEIYQTVQLQSLDNYYPVCISAVYINEPTPEDQLRYVYKFYISSPEHPSHTKYYTPDHFRKIYETDQDLSYDVVLAILNFIYMIYASHNQ